MKKRLHLFILVIILSSCSNTVSKKDLEGVWWFYDGSGDGELIFENDSVTVDNGYGLPNKARYKLKKDSILISFEGNTKTDFLKYNYKDSILFYKNAKYYKRYKTADSLGIVHKKFDLINIQSKTILHSDSLNKSSSIFRAFKNGRNELKLVLNDTTTSVEDLSSFLLVTNCFGGEQIHHPPYLLLGKKTSLRDLKEIYIYSNVVNYDSIHILTYYDFLNRLFHSYKVNIEIFREETLELVPHTKKDIYRKDYIKKFKPENIVIKSKEDFVKLDTLKTHLNYLISIDIDLPIEEYLHLNQKINTLRKKEKFNIRTELIEMKTN
ncbi:hypothetical protein [Tenacibaculum sp. 190524A05c]|uniref:DKNYY family protein n=1 Tax=Tenacibaculum platacis TaxID=3137852 RepID=A0ABM9NY15_9FLAO